MTVLGIDPGVNTGWALVTIIDRTTHSYMLLGHGTIRTEAGDDHTRVGHIAGTFLNSLPQPYDRVVIEQPPTYTRKHMNVASLMTLAMCYGAALVGVHGPVVYQLAPSGRRRRGLATKATARMLCVTWFGADATKGMSDHSCDAAVLAVSGLR